jgi:succinoglycan biosynthesis transport protein ExoP
MAQEGTRSPDLATYLAIFARRKWLIAFITVIVTAAVTSFTFRQTPIYEGRAKVLVRPLVVGETVISPNLETERQLIQSEAVAETVQKQTGPSRDILRHVLVDVVTGTEVFEVKFEDPSPQTAARLANAFATAYIKFRGEDAIEQLNAQTSAVRQEINEIHAALDLLNRRIRNSADPTLKTSFQSQRDTLIGQLGFLQQRLFELQSNVSAARSSAELVQPASTPESPVRPRKIRNGLLALVAGIALGLGMAMLRERLDDRVKGRTELASDLGVSVIASVPRVHGWRNRDETELVMASQPKSAASESYRTLGANIQYLASTMPLKVIQITSTQAGEGKTTTAANLAVALARSGHPVVVMSADLRRPRLHEFFSLRDAPGLSNVLSNSGAILDVAQRPNVMNLKVVSSGPAPADPAALLSSRRARKWLENVRTLPVDFVIIDSPPVLPVADASILASLVDGTVLVVDARHSSRPAMSHAREQLERAGATIIGAVYNNVDPGKDGSYYRYSYSYS